MGTDDTFEGVTAAQLQRAYAKTMLLGLMAQDEALRHGTSPSDILRARHRHAIGVEHLLTKDAAGASGWAAKPTPLAAAFVSEIDRSVLEPLGGPRFQFLIPVPSTASGATFSWVPEALPAPVGQVVLTTGAVTPEPTKVSGIVCVPRQFLRQPTRASMDHVLRIIANQYSAFVNQQLVDPDVTAVANERPGALTENATPITSSGSENADMVEDARALLARFVGNGGKVVHAVVIMSSATAVALRLSGHRAFSDLTPTGGTYMGIQAIAGEGVGPRIVMVDRSHLVVADDGPVDIAVTSVADLEMLDGSLQQNGTTGAGAQLVSLWQSDLLAFKLTRHLYWGLTDTTAGCQYIAGVSYVQAGSPA